MRLTTNLLAERGVYAPEAAEIVSARAAAEAQARIAKWQDYAPTPLRPLNALARELGVAEVRYKDEAHRFGQGSFKVLGGAYAAERLLDDVAPGAPTTLCCATDGNHGRSVAFAAERSGLPCVVLMHANAPEPKRRAIERLGAKVMTVPGSYDDAVVAARDTAARNGWMFIQDTSDDAADVATRHVMRGYGVMVLELLTQLGAASPPTHVFLQAGVGGFAAAIAGVFADLLGAERPTFVIVEPDRAACLFESAVRYRPSRIEGDFKTSMEMLVAGVPSSAAWVVLERYADAFMTIDDDVAIETALRISRWDQGGDRLDVGVSGAAGAAGLIELAKHPALRERVGLTADARVLLFGTEASGAEEPM
jgi:diaminopropionate ammonia-lyase